MTWPARSGDAATGELVPSTRRPDWAAIAATSFAGGGAPGRLLGSLESEEGADTLPIATLFCERIDEGVLASIQELSRSANTIVVVFHSQSSPEEEIQALESGAAECLALRFSVDRLKAQLRTLTRRHPRRSIEGPSGLQLDLRGFAATLDGRPLRLSPLEFKLLGLLWPVRGEVVVHRRVEEALYGETGIMVRQAVRQLVHRLRSRLGSAGEMLVAVPGIGYSLRVPPRSGNLRAIGPPAGERLGAEASS
jgi:DNA-binding response OmpR family regulator